MGKDSAVPKILEILLDPKEGSYKIHFTAPIQNMADVRSKEDLLKAEMMKALDEHKTNPEINQLHTYVQTHENDIEINIDGPFSGYSVHALPFRWLALMMTLRIF